MGHQGCHRDDPKETPRVFGSSSDERRTSDLGASEPSGAIQVHLGAAGQIMGAHKNLKRRLGDPKMMPRDAQGALRGFQEDPKRHPRGAQRRHEATRGSLRGAKDGPPPEAQESPKKPQKAPVESQGSPKRRLKANVSENAER